MADILPRITTETINPSQAKKMLENNRNNRNPSQQRIDELASQMRQGKYIMPPDAITFDRQGRLINGQHRLLACVQSGTTIQSIVYRNASEEVFMITDIGMRKTGGHALKTLGYTNTTNLSAAARVVYNLETTPEGEPWWAFAGHVPPNDIIEIIKMYPTLQSHVNEGHKLTAKKRASRIRTSMTVIALCLHLAWKADQYDDMRSFLETVATGVGIEQGSPELALMRYLNRAEASTTKLEGIACSVAIILKAYIAKQTGKDVQVLSWRPTDKYPTLTAKEPQ
jgi:ParB-like nuclease domain